MKQISVDYRCTVKENIQYMLTGFFIAMILGILFYRSLLGVLFISPIILLYRKDRIRKHHMDLMWKLNLEFKDAINALSAALEAGYSIEHALEEACEELKLIYPENAIIVKEFSYMINQVRMNITVEKALTDFADRSGVDDILNFAEVFCTAKRTGGDLIHIIKITSNMISDKIEVKRGIVTLISAKRLEANIMKIVPLFILVYLSVSSKDFLDPLYHNLSGVIIMTLMLIGYLGAYLLIDKILAIEI